MRWPPNKAWTSAYLMKGYRHFVAVNYGGSGKSRWVNLVAVLDTLVPHIKALTTLEELWLAGNHISGEIDAVHRATI